AVVRLLPRTHARVTERLDRLAWELVVLELGFLQREHIRLRARAPLFDVRQTHAEGVDVPAGDFHGRPRSGERAAGGTEPASRMAQLCHNARPWCAELRAAASAGSGSSPK